MAIPTSGITASFGGTALGEITEIKWTQGGGLPQSRGSTAAGSAPWSFDAGAIEISSVGTSLGNISQWGKKAVLAVGGTTRVATATATIVTVNLTTKTICQTLELGAKVNDAWRYKGTFKIVLE